MRDRQDGLIAAEFAAAMALLVLPAALLVLLLPVWLETQHAGRAAAQQAARAAALAPSAAGAVTAAERTASTVLANHAVGLVDVAVAGDPATTDPAVTVRVTVAVPMLRLPVVGEVATWPWTASATVPLDPYRSRP